MDAEDAETGSLPPSDLSWCHPGDFPAGDDDVDVVSVLFDLMGLERSENDP
jgi:hypothetical protein